MTNTLLLLAQAVIYFGVMAALFRARHRFGIGLFVCALGAMHFLETYLASVFYVSLPFGIISPGSTVMFSGKLIMLLLLYIREDAETVRQPIYGLLIGNFLMVALVLVLRQHEVVSAVPGRLPNLSFIDEMGWLMIIGTSLLFVDAIAIILFYERLGRLFRDRIVLRLFTASACVLTFDQLGFWIGLHLVSGAPLSVLFGGWVAKLAAAAVYSVLVGAYLRWFEAPPVTDRRRIVDVFDVLTYRERYEKLLETSGRDGLTGAFDRGRFESVGREVVEDARRVGDPVSLLMVDADHFKAINDRYGHGLGDDVLRLIVAEIAGVVRASDLVFRYGGEEIVVLARGTPHGSAVALAERIRVAVRSSTGAVLPEPITVSIGVATCPRDGTELRTLFDCADQRLYSAKASGRDCVIGALGVEWSHRAPDAGTTRNRTA